MKNGNFDLVHGLTNKAEALNVYDQYVKDSADCPQCQDLWRKVKEDDRRHHDMLLSEINRHAKEGKLQ
jgi:hypothetical protein